MTRIGLLSDTHAYWDDKYYKYFDSCDEIWHAGDLGTDEIADQQSSQLSQVEASPAATIMAPRNTAPTAMAPTFPCTTP